MNNLRNSNKTTQEDIVIYKAIDVTAGHLIDSLVPLRPSNVLSVGAYVHDEASVQFTTSEV